MNIHDCALVVSGLLNSLVLMYGCLYVVAKSFRYRQEEKLAVCVEMINGKTVSSFAHTVSKAIIGMLSSLAMVGMALYITVTSDISTNPFFTYDDSITVSSSLLIAVSLFNMVLVLLREKLTARNIHEIPVSMVTGMISIAILMLKEDGLLGVICSFMFGSVFADELLNIHTVVVDRKERRSSKLIHVFRLSMHLLCNFVFPIIMFSVPSCFSKQNLFEMERTSIVIFFFAATFLIFCNAWRLTGTFRNLWRKQVTEECTDRGVGADAWRANAVSVILVPMVSKRLAQLIKSGHSEVTKNNDYVITNDLPKIHYLPKVNELPEVEAVVDDNQNKRFQDIDINAIF